MLGDYTPVATLAVSDVARAREFYEGVLGLAPRGDMEVPDGVVYSAGDSFLLVYPSTYAGTNKATAVSFQVPGDAFDAEVSALRANGVAFQTFELGDMVWEDGVASWGPQRSVWFEDPDGNILNVGTGALG